MLNFILIVASVVIASALWSAALDAAFWCVRKVMGLK